MSFATQRDAMVDRQIAARGVRAANVLDAMRTVPRHKFVRDDLSGFAYDDVPLPIEEGQTISQPFIVALMAEALKITPTDRVLEIGSGCGYAAAVLSELAQEVFTIERHAGLAESASDRLRRLGFSNVSVRHGDGTLGWPEHAPYGAIQVTAGGPEIPEALLDQLAIGGRLVVPVGAEPRTQELLRIRRTGPHTFDETSLGKVQFVPLVGSAGWALDGKPMVPHRAAQPLRIKATERRSLAALIRESAEPIGDIDDAELGPILDRIGGAHVVLLGEATHGTSEFYRMRNRITRSLIVERGFNVVAIEGDWPDVSAIDRQVRPGLLPPREGPTFQRFPTWMWRNQEVSHFVGWLTRHNRTHEDPDRRVSVHGLDLYSLNDSIAAVLDYLDEVDPQAAAAARVRYGCLSPWETDPATYGRAAVSGRLAGCEDEIAEVLTGLLDRRLEYVLRDGETYFDAERNAAVVREAERYYRAMYRGSRESWNLRDSHMFDVLRAVLDHRGEHAKAVVWAHNSHVGNAAATEMGVRGELNIGQLARETYLDAAYNIGFGTDRGTVAAASEWGSPMQVMTVRPAHRDSYESLCHESAVSAFTLSLRAPPCEAVREELLEPHLERAIGVIYRPESELVSHYFQAALPAQFDEYIWFDETSAVHPLAASKKGNLPDISHLSA